MWCTWQKDKRCSWCASYAGFDERVVVSLLVVSAAGEALLHSSHWQVSQPHVEPQCLQQPRVDPQL
jgi:hypothetical protein